MFRTELPARYLQFLDKSLSYDFFGSGRRYFVGAVVASHSCTFFSLSGSSVVCLLSFRVNETWIKKFNVANKNREVITVWFF
jgi:hypothetical protein